MNDQEFLTAANSFLDSILDGLDAFDPDDVDADLSMGVLKMQFADGTVSVMNRQTAAHQIWLASGATAWHFELRAADQTWQDTKGRGSLADVLAEVLSKRMGRTVQLSF